MAAGDRFKNWISDTASGFADRLATWTVGAVSRSITRSLESEEPSVIDLTREYLTRIRNSPEVPQETKDMIDKALAAGSWGKVGLGWIMTIVGVVMQALSLGRPIGRQMEYAQDLIVRSARLDPSMVITAWRRDAVTNAHWFDDLKDLGWSDERIEALKFITQFYPGPSDLVRFQAREVFEPEMISRYGLDDEFGSIDLEPFRKAGMTDEITKYYWRAHWEHASWNQVVEMLHRGQLTEDQVRDWFRLVEIPPFWRDKLIATSWNVPTRVDVRRFYDLRTINEARLREIYTAMGYHGKDLDDYVLWTKIYVEFPDLLARWKNGWISLDQLRSRLTGLGMSYEAAEELIQTKVQAEGASRTAAERELTKADIYKGVKEERITRLEGLELLMDLGYDEDEASYILDIYAPSDETVSAAEQRQLTKADVLKGLKTGVITELGARQMLLELRYSPADVEFLIKIFRAQVEPPEEIKLKEASKADIVLGVTKGLITPTEAHAMLLDIGYAPEAADFILLVKATESPFSPTNINEFKDLTTKWRRSAGMQTTPVPDEIRAAADELVKIKLEVESLERAEKEERRQLVPDEEVPASASKKLKQIQVALNRARAELQRIQLKYDSLVAAWKHGAEK